MTDNEFLDRVREKHGSRYDLSITKYTERDRQGRVSVLCNTHGLFLKWAWDLLGGSGCAKCVGQGKDSSEYITEMQTAAPQYDFSQFVYVNARTKSTVVCPSHGPFLSTANVIKNGHGCLRCGTERALRKRIDTGQARHPDHITEYEQYRKDVWRETHKTYKAHASELGERNRLNHLDHIYSIAEGWANKVDPKVLGSRVNLRIISGKLNRQKNSKSGYTLDQLYEAYAKALVYPA